MDDSDCVARGRRVLVLCRAGERRRRDLDGRPAEGGLHGRANRVLQSAPFLLRCVSGAGRRAAYGGVIVNPRLPTHSLPSVQCVRSRLDCVPERAPDYKMGRRDHLALRQDECAGWLRLLEDRVLEEENGGQENGGGGRLADGRADGVTGVLIAASGGRRCGAEQGGSCKSTRPRVSLSPPSISRD